MPPAAVDDPLVRALGAAVSAARNRRVPLRDLRAAHARHDPTGASSHDARVRLAEALRTLEDAGTLTVPRGAKLFETRVQPPLPMWVERPAAVSAVPAAARARVWRPELTTAAAVASTPADLEVLGCVEDFLRGGGSSRPVVPHRERSVAVFGYEKRLDALLRTRLFTSGALTLDLLRCYVAPLPLTAQHTGDPGPLPQLLIVENHATYASVLTLSRQRAAAGAPAVAIGYGSGNQLVASVTGATQLAPRPAAMWYFGDLDPNGLRIAAAADRVARAAGLPPLRPAVPLYRELVRHGQRQLGARAAVSGDVADDLVSWLEDAPLQVEVRDLLVCGQRLAQESLGYEGLTLIDRWF